MNFEYNFARMFLNVVILSDDASTLVYQLRPRQNDPHFTENKSIFLNRNVCFSFKNPLKFASKAPIDNKAALFQVRVWLQPGYKPLSEINVIQFNVAYMRPGLTSNGFVPSDLVIYTEQHIISEYVDLSIKHKQMCLDFLVIDGLISVG